MTKNKYGQPLPPKGLRLRDLRLAIIDPGPAASTRCCSFAPVLRQQPKIGTVQTGSSGRYVNNDGDSTIRVSENSQLHTPSIQLPPTGPTRLVRRSVCQPSTATVPEPCGQLPTGHRPPILRSRAQGQRGSNGQPTEPSGPLDEPECARVILYSFIACCSKRLELTLSRLATACGMGKHPL